MAARADRAARRDGTPPAVPMANGRRLESTAPPDGSTKAELRGTAHRRQDGPMRDHTRLARLRARQRIRCLGGTRPKLPSRTLSPRPLRTPRAITRRVDAGSSCGVSACQTSTGSLLAAEMRRWLPRAPPWRAYGRRDREQLRAGTVAMPGRTARMISDRRVTRRFVRRQERQLVDQHRDHV